jgi:hypothetical protein
MNLMEKKIERMKQLERLLVTPMTCHEMAKVVGWPSPSVRTYVGELHDRGRIHVASWRKSGRLLAAMYQAGEGPDAEKPCIQRSLCHADGSEDEESPFHREPVAVQVRRDDLVAALFGPFYAERAAA